jgi:hypothetical protein
MCKSPWVVLAVLIVPAFAQADTTYVANSGSNSVSVITNDSGTNTVSVIKHQRQRGDHCYGWQEPL